MTTTTRSLLALALLTGACPDPRPAGDEHGAHGHPHGAAGEELPGVAVTVWTARTELFMEHRALIVGQKTAFAAHLTEMPSFKAVTAGKVTLTLELAGGAATQGAVDAPTSPGIFRPELTPPAAGPCTLKMTIASPQLEDTFVVGPCEVFADAAAARKTLGDDADPPGRITFLKEQQWKTAFATAPIEERELVDAVQANAQVQPAAGKEARLTAATAGRVVVAEPAPVLGMLVKKGQVLATIAPRLGSGTDRASLDADAEAARVELAAAEAQLARTSRLAAEKAVPEKALEEARARVDVARARQAGSAGRLAQYQAGASASGGAGRGGFQVRAPIDGTLVAAEVTTGQVVEEGQALFTVIDLAQVWLVAQVFEPDIPRVERAQGGWYEVEGYPAPFPIDASTGRVVTVGRVLDAKTRTIPVIFELANADGRLRIGQFAKAWIATGAPRRALAIPDAAIVDDAGKPTAYVMVEGEAFERRPLTLGVRSRGVIEVLDGVRAGERVVTRGAYEIKLSAASGAIPAHGHAH